MIRINTCNFRPPATEQKFDSHITATKMKIAIILVALLGCANATLRDDFYEMWALVPHEEILAITREYIANDEEFTVLINWAKTDLITIAHAVGQHPTWQVLVDFLASKDLDIYVIVERAKGALGLASRDAVAYASRPDYFASRSVRGWYAEVKALIPVDDVLALYREKKETSADFQEFIALITSETFHTFVTDIGGLEEVQNALESGRQYGVDVDAFLDIAAGVLGWVRS